MLNVKENYGNGLEIVFSVLCKITVEFLTGSYEIIQKTWKLLDIIKHRLWM